MSTTLLEMRRSKRRPSRRRPAGAGAFSGRDGRSGGAGAGGGAHTPVLAAELLELLAPQPGQTAIDCTFGDGGHARLVAERLGASGTLIAIDRDPLAEQRFGRLADDVACDLRFIRGGYAEALTQLGEEGIRADAAYFDLGMSSMQVDTRERGFSYSYEAPLDMRMDPEQELTAREIVAEWDERRLARALRDFGEERHAGAIARAIVRRRAQAPIETTLELVETINAAIPTPARFAGGHPAKRSFQALRIAVNDELEQLDRALPLAWSLLREGGVLAGHLLPLARGPPRQAVPRGARSRLHLPARPAGLRLRSRARGGAPDASLDRAVAEELAGNPRSASARLRAARKLTGEHSDLDRSVAA